MTGKNVFGGDLEFCSTRPLTGFTRSGDCDTSPQDSGSHTVCAQVTKEFLEFSRREGNDLISPHPAIGFPGLKPGDRWCLCASRWREALQAGCAPGVILAATNDKALEIVSLEELKRYAIDLV